MCGESLIIVRGSDREVRALLNVCRHRGSRVCTERPAALAAVASSARTTPGTTRSTVACARPPEWAPDFERAAHGLSGCMRRVIEGLIFVSFAQQSRSVSSMSRRCSPAARVSTAGRMRRVAHRETYAVNANWKLAVENYMECYHCGPAHEEYSRFHLYARPAALNSEADERVRARAAESGFIGGGQPLGRAGAARTGGRRQPALGARGGHGQRQRGRHGARPLMGQFTDYDGGVTFFDVGLTSDFLAYPDHGLIYRFIPRSVDCTDMEVIWLVRG